MASHGGNIKKRQARNKRNGPRNKTQSGQVYVTYCPVCSPESHADPEKNVRVVVSSRTKRGVCKNGHTFPVGQGSHSGYLGDLEDKQ